MGEDLWRGGVLGPVGAILGSLGAILGPFGVILEPLGAILGPSWGHLGASGGHLGASKGAPVGRPGGMHEAFKYLTILSYYEIILCIAVL